MSRIFKTENKQLRLLAIVLAAAIILPSSCLLWFMTRTIQNERFGVIERVRRLSQNQIDLIDNAIKTAWMPLAAVVGHISDSDSRRCYARLLNHPAIQCDGALVFSLSGQLLYPVVSDTVIAQDDSPGVLKNIWSIEFVNRDIEKAGTLYQQLARQTIDPLVRQKALAAQARCLMKRQLEPEAMAIYRQLGWPVSQKEPMDFSIVCQARLMVLKAVCSNENEPRVVAAQQIMANKNIDGSDHWLVLPLDRQVFYLEKAIEIIRQAGMGDILANDLNAAERDAAAGKLALMLAYETDIIQSAPNLAHGQLTRLSSKEAVYGIPVRNQALLIVLLYSEDSLLNLIKPAVADLLRDDVATCEIYSPDQILLEKQDRVLIEPLLIKQLAIPFAGWEVRLYLNDDNYYKQRVQQQSLFYLWTGLLVIAAIVIIGILTMRMVGRQMRLSQLKNDFIATVTHELKTPLASTRLLVDTLLEGRYRDQNKVNEYLRLISNENQRLTRLIENFLTFSRMERNKQAFEFLPDHPESIVGDAVAAIQTKYHHNECRFKQEISGELCEVLVDHDAMVTVLINLLDNACKYTTKEDKRIQLKVYLEDQWTCFAVSDNGCGFSRKVARRLFDKFFQADRSLTRQTEGCGLGLSIVKFIVDAHHGQIKVTSQPGIGSTFIVKIPTYAKT